MTKTTALLKKLGVLVLVVAALAVASAKPAHAGAGNLLGLQVAHESEIYDARRVTYSSSTAGAAMRAVTLYYVGTATGAQVSITQTAMTFYAPANTADTSIGTSGVITLSAAPNDTVGGLCDTINATTYWRCVMRDARRSDNTTLLLDQTFSAANGNLDAKVAGGYDVAFDTGGVIGGANTPYFLSIGINPAPGRHVTLKSCIGLVNSSGAAFPTLTVSGKKRKFGDLVQELSPSSINDASRSDSTVVWADLMTSSTTAQTFNFDDTGLGGIDFADGSDGASPQILPNAYAANPGRVVVRAASDVTTTVQGSTNFLRCYWVER